MLLVARKGNTGGMESSVLGIRGIEGIKDTGVMAGSAREEGRKSHRPALIPSRGTGERGSAREEEGRRSHPLALIPSKRIGEGGNAREEERRRAHRLALIPSRGIGSGAIVNAVRDLGRRGHPVLTRREGSGNAKENTGEEAVHHLPMKEDEGSVGAVDAIPGREEVSRRQDPTRAVNAEIASTSGSGILTWSSQGRGSVEL